MGKFEGKTVEDVLKSNPVIQTRDLSELLHRSTRTLNRWQNQSVFENPMPRPFSESRGAGNNFDSGKILEWYKTLPMRKKETLACS